jgi:hypothetical protein
MGGQEVLGGKDIVLAIPFSHHRRRQDREHRDTTRPLISGFFTFLYIFLLPPLLLMIPKIPWPEQGGHGIRKSSSGFIWTYGKEWQKKRRKGTLRSTLGSPRSATAENGLAPLGGYTYDGIRM